MTSFTDYTEEDQRLHDFVITHNRKLKDIKTIVSNIMWELQALTDSFEGFQFITADEFDLDNIVRSYDFSPGINNSIRFLINNAKCENQSVHKYSLLQTIAHKHNLLPEDLLKVAKTDFTDLCCKE